MTDNFVILTTYSNPQDAYIVRGMLEDHGIPAVVADDNNLYVPVFSGVRLLVRASDAQRAQDLLKEFHD